MRWVEGHLWIMRRRQVGESKNIAAWCRLVHWPQRIKNGQICWKPTWMSSEDSMINCGLLSSKGLRLSRRCRTMRGLIRRKARSKNEERTRMMPVASKDQSPDWLCICLNSKKWKPPLTICMMFSRRGRSKFRVRAPCQRKLQTLKAWKKF